MSDTPISSHSAALTLPRAAELAPHAVVPA